MVQDLGFFGAFASVFLRAVATGQGDSNGAAWLK